MPIYEYQCPQCHRLFEEWVSLSRAHGQEPCPDCGTPSPRVISHTSFVLKGGGWYVSDYGYRKGIKEEGGGASEAAPKTGGATPAPSGDATPKASPPPAPSKPAKPAKAAS